jgi:glycosyltransferase involved in cell wall biosynthesis
MQDDTPVSHPVPDALLSEVVALRRRTEDLELRARHLTASALLQDLRSGAQAYQAYHLQQELRLIQSSTIWRATWPLRLMLDVLRGVPPDGSREALFLRRVVATAKRRGVRAGLAEFAGGLGRWTSRRKKRAAAVVPQEATEEVETAAAKQPLSSEVLAPNVLIIAELTLPQCAKYRVWQKQESFLRLGVPCRVVDWRLTQDCLAAAALATQVILYRVPGYPNILKLIAQLHALKLPLAWEVDDLIFDRDLFLKNRNVDELDEDLRESIISGVDLYLAAMLACGSGIASTACLAETMRGAGLDDVVVVENALDSDTLALAAALRAKRIAKDDDENGDVLITYGSGTKTHDADFREAAPALLRLLALFPWLRLRIVGELTLPSGFDAFADRVERLPPATFPYYMQLLSESDICIAPLEPTLFNDAKSNIKFLEGAILGLPSVCSPRMQFRDLITHGTTGFLADNEASWFEGLSTLIQDAALRREMGQAALHLAFARYDPEAIARTQVAKLLDRAPDRRRAVDLRVMFANIYYAPRSFGGATLVVEEMARRLQADPATEVHLLTSLGPGAAEQVLTRTEQEGISIYSLPVPGGDVVAEFDNPAIGQTFGRMLDAVQPHVVHLHAVQWLSASLAVACLERGIPYVITLHDAWWLCARQFMVTEAGKYCFQEKIDLRVCNNCMPGARHLEDRMTALRTVLDGAALLLSPSEAHRKLYLANGIAPEKIEVAPNGIRKPETAPPTRTPGRTIRFAYVGGNVEVKGFSIVKRAFEALARADWELLLVDNTQHLGFSSMHAEDWKIAGKLSIVPAYTQDGIDAFFAGFDVLLFPSQWKESFGLTVREALARNVWVIATEGGGPGEAIVDGVNGSLIPLDGRSEPLRQAVENLLDSPDLLDRFHNPAQIALHDYDTQAVSLRATLAGVVERHRAAHAQQEVGW